MRGKFLLRDKKCTIGQQRVGEMARVVFTFFVNMV